MNYIIFCHFKFSSFEVYFCFYSFNQNIQKLPGTTYTHSVLCVLKKRRRRRKTVCFFFTSKIINLTKERENWSSCQVVFFWDFRVSNITYIVIITWNSSFFFVNHCPQRQWLFFFSRKIDLQTFFFKIPKMLLFF